MIRKLTQEEKDMIYIALGMRENYIETGHIAYDAATVQKIWKNDPPRGVKIKALSIDQMKLLVASNKLKGEILMGKLRIED